MKVYEIGTGYTPIPATMGAATEIVVEELTKAFLEQNMPVEIVDIRAKERKAHSLPLTEVWVPGCFAGTDVRLGVMHKLKRVVYSISLAQKLKKILRKIETGTILHFHNQYNLFFFLKLAPARLRKKVIIAYTVHSYIWHGQWDEIEKTVKERYFQEVCCLQNADLIFVLNERTRENIIENVGTDESKVKLIGNGVSTDSYKPLSVEEIRQIKASRGLDGKKLFIQVGSVCDRKNQLESLRLLMPLLKRDSGMVFAYAGGLVEPEYEEKIRRFAVENGVDDQVCYFGELRPGKELNAFYNMGEAMIFPSKAEGFSLVIVEAMAAGVPVVINNQLQFSLAEACIRYEDDASFSEAVVQRVLDQEARMCQSDQGRKQVVAQYSWKKIASDYEKEWREAH